MTSTGQTGDTIHSGIDNAGNVIVGKDNTQRVYHEPAQGGDRNVQQVVNVHSPEGHPDAPNDSEHVLTVRLLNQAMLHYFGEMKREFRAEMNALRAEVRAEITKEVAVLRSEITEQNSTRENQFVVLQRESDTTLMKAMDGLVMLPENHETIFNLAFVALYAPVPFFYSQVRELIGVSWAAALGMATVAYLVSSYLWRHMWRGGRRAR